MSTDHPQRGNVVVPAASAFGVRTELRPEGGAVVEIARQPHLVDRHGALVAGVLGLVNDHALGGAIAPVMAHDELMITSHMHMELMVPFTAATTALHGSGRVVHKGGGSAFTGGTVTDADGQLLATMTARFAMLPLGATAGSAVRAADTGLANPPQAEQAPALIGGLDPINDFLGLDVVDATGGAATIRVRAARHLANERFGVHGGVGVLIGERCVDVAIRSRVANADDFHPVEMRTVFLRPIAADDSMLTCTATVSYAGRSVITSTATLCTAAGKPAVEVDLIHAARRR